LRSSSIDSPFTSDYALLVRERGCVPFIRLFAAKVKKKMKEAAARLKALPREKHLSRQKTKSGRIVLVLRGPIYGVAAIIAGSLAFASACGRHARVKVPPSPQPAAQGSTETGVASWYGVPYDGRLASSGEIFDMRKLTAAHRTLPFDTWVEVTNLQNGKQVDVRINDRGPFVDGRIIDLSMAAANQIDMIRSGTARVRLRILPASASAGEYAVQAGAFSDRDRAETFRRTLAFPEARVVRGDGDPILWRVLIGRKMQREAAENLAARIRGLGNDTLVVRDPE